MGSQCPHPNVGVPIGISVSPPHCWGPHWDLSVPTPMLGSPLGSQCPHPIAGVPIGISASPFQHGIPTPPLGPHWDLRAPIPVSGSPSHHRPPHRPTDPGEDPTLNVGLGRCPPSHSVPSRKSHKRRLTTSGRSSGSQCPASGMRWRWAPGAIRCRRYGASRGSRKASRPPHRISTGHGGRSWGTGESLRGWGGGRGVRGGGATPTGWIPKWGIPMGASQIGASQWEHRNRSIPMGASQKRASQMHPNGNI